MEDRLQANTVTVEVSIDDADYDAFGKYMATVPWGSVLVRRTVDHRLVRDHDGQA